MNDILEPAPLNPVVGDWYADAQGVTFEVVAVDEEAGTIEVQYFDGTVEEYDGDSWQELGLKPVDPPEDWSGSVDMDREDYGGGGEEEHAEMWANPLDQFN